MKNFIYGMPTMFHTRRYGVDTNRLVSEGYHRRKLVINPDDEKERLESDGYEVIIDDRRPYLGYESATLWTKHRCTRENPHWNRDMEKCISAEEKGALMQDARETGGGWDEFEGRAVNPPTPWMLYGGIGAGVLAVATILIIVLKK